MSVRVADGAWQLPQMDLMVLLKRKKKIAKLHFDDSATRFNRE